MVWGVEAELSFSTVTNSTSNFVFHIWILVSTGTMKICPFLHLRNSLSIPTSSEISQDHLNMSENLPMKFVPHGEAGIIIFGWSALPPFRER